MVEEHGDVPMKVLYDVAPTFENFDNIDTHDGCIRHGDMQRLRDIFDGSNADGGFAMPPAKANVWTIWGQADKNQDGCVDKQEFDDSEMGHAFEKAMPTPPDAKPVGDAVESVGEGVGDVAASVGDAASAAGGAISDVAGHAGEHVGDIAADVDEAANPPDETISGEAEVSSPGFLGKQGEQGKHGNHRAGSPKK